MPLPFVSPPNPALDRSPAMSAPGAHRETPETPTFKRRVLDLVAGDVIVADGSLDLKVTNVSDVIHGFVIVSYHAGPSWSLADDRTMVAAKVVDVRRPVPA